MFLIERITEGGQRVIQSNSLRLVMYLHPLIKASKQGHETELELCKKTSEYEQNLKGAAFNDTQYS